MSVCLHANVPLAISHPLFLLEESIHEYRHEINREC